VQGRIEEAKEREEKKAASRRNYVTKMNKRKKKTESTRSFIGTIKRCYNA
jgi:hypothetical protein